MIGLTHAAVAADFALGLVQGLATAPAVRVQPVAADSLHPAMAPAWAFWMLATLTVVDPEGNDVTPKALRLAQRSGQMTQLDSQLLN